MLKRNIAYLLILLCSATAFGQSHSGTITVKKVKAQDSVWTNVVIATRIKESAFVTDTLYLDDNELPEYLKNPGLGTVQRKFVSRQEYIAGRSKNK
ncbi:MAG: hypothetical protein JWO44_1346 [Bacteroidetes bacterium]|jgi:hypothetical protein|nr:hypothetical protein [Bacteroidota bacterium]